MISVKGYRILKKLGSGGMAIVYLAEHEKLGKKVAIKVLSDLLTSNSSVRKRFIQEARVMASLLHPGIVDVTDFIEEEHLLAIVMEYIPGRTLDTMIGSEVGPIPYEKAVPLFRQILEAVAYAHSKGVIHRDLKPANVMVTADEKIKVMDFGIAKIAGQTGMTRTGTQLGTLYYMPPEQIHGAGSIDSRADIYSLGITLYEILAGRLSFAADGDTSEFQIMNSIVNRENHLDPREYYPHIPEWLVNVVKKATAKSPNYRYQSCKEFLKALDEVEKGPAKEVPPFLGEIAGMDSIDKTAQAPITPKPVKKRNIYADYKAKFHSILQSRIPFSKISSFKTEWVISSIAAVLFVVLALVILGSDNDLSPGPLFGMVFKEIPSGDFEMGSPSTEDDRDSNEKQHRVYVASFELMTTEVTQSMWEEAMGDNPSSGQDYPVYNVSWNDCQDFIDELNDLDPNHTYRLPTEAEWEYACRAGTTARFYWGNSDLESTIGRYCWYSSNSNSSTHPVGTKQPNAWDLYDMSGNVWEWCQDVFTSDYDDCPIDGSAYSGSGSLRVLRGGGWYYGAHYCRSAIRFSYNPGTISGRLGFRLARS